MQIKREFEMVTRASRRFIIRQSPIEADSIACAACGEPMVDSEQAAKLFGVNQRRIFQIIETGIVHFLETNTGTTLVCITSLSAENDETRSVSFKAIDDNCDEIKELIADSK